MPDWNAWIGREEVRDDFADPGLFARWLATLDRAAPGMGVAAQGFHWCLCTPDAPTALLGTDGHPLRSDRPDSFLPPLPLPRRMWASSKVDFLAPIALDRDVRRKSRVVSITEKSGASGPLAFVEIAHETWCESATAIREVQSLVYRAEAAADAPLSPPARGEGTFNPGEWQAHRALVPGEALLFRYSALTFNSHRIHYDLPYARDVERYRGLVVHGPLMATMLLDLAARELGDNTLKSFAFRGISPAVAGEMLHLVLRSKDAAFELGAYAADGRQVMSASAAV
ncbi:MaoC family dehydratase N-terminal domain-containing protein [Novosphingobium aquiterrae]|uniref:MaoC family dehydratase N-terminal domain-containing protein n=1 Tax=Novosphingobium aquiterrae TaxID=624388 RepID=A0ABV6PL04_9SPHN